MPSKYMVIDGSNQIDLQTKLNDPKLAGYKATLITVHPGTFNILVVMEKES
jgi:hypothetical protein